MTREEKVQVALGTKHRYKVTIEKYQDKVTIERYQDKVTIEKYQDGNASWLLDYTWQPWKIVYIISHSKVSATTKAYEMFKDVIKNVVNYRFCIKGIKYQVSMYNNKIIRRI